jgi:hypothetical protein
VNQLLNTKSKNVEHSFNIHYAKRYGLHEAIMIKNFQFWISKNKANRNHNHDGRTWTYNSVRAFEELFPYFTSWQVRKCLDSLVEQGVLVKGNYHKNPYERSSWYAFSDESMFLDSQDHLCSTSNGNDEDIKSITDSKPNEKPNKKELDFRGLNEAAQIWLDYKKEKKQSYKTVSSTQALINKLYELSSGDLEIAKKVVVQSMANNYSGLFELRSETRGKFSAPAARPAVPASQSPMANQDNHSNYADYVAWCERNNVTPEPERP